MCVQASLVLGFFLFFNWGCETAGAVKILPSGATVSLRFGITLESYRSFFAFSSRIPRLWRTLFVSVKTEGEKKKENKTDLPRTCCWVDRRQAREGEKWCRESERLKQKGRSSLSSNVNNVFNWHFFFVMWQYVDKEEGAGFKKLIFIKCERRSDKDGELLLGDREGGKGSGWNSWLFFFVSAVFFWPGQ